MKLLILLLYLALTVARQYVAELENENPFVPCEDYPDLFLTKFLDYSNITFNLLENNTLHVQGHFDVTNYVTDVVGMRIDAYKKERGVYVNTVFSINRPDFCNSLFSPMEYWYPIAKQIPQNERVCPFQKGMTYNVNTFTVLEFDFPDKAAEGYYKIHIQFYYRKTKAVAMCIDILTGIFRL